VSEVAVLNLIIVSLTSSILGVPLVLKRLSLLGAGLSHSALGGVAIAYLMGLSPLPTTLIYTLLMGILIYTLSSRGKVSGDAVIAVLFTSGVALGILVLGDHSHSEAHLSEAILGEPFKVSWYDLILSIFLLLLTLLFILRLRNHLTLLCFNEDLAVSYGIRVDMVAYSLLILSSLSIVLAVKVVGVLLASALFVIPAMTSLFLVSGFGRAVLLSSAVSLICTSAGVIITERTGFQPGGVVVFALLLMFMASFLFNQVRSRLQ